MIPKDNMRSHSVKTFLHLLQSGRSLKITERDHLTKTVQVYLEGDLLPNEVAKAMAPEQLGPQ
jgi:hypothetical protein